MRVVIDTNVLVSGLLSPFGPPGRIVDLLTSGLLVLLFDDRTMQEYQDVLYRPKFGFRLREVDTLLAFLRTEGEHITTQPSNLEIKDLMDLPFVEIALQGLADFLITGNLKDFKFEKPEIMELIVSPNQFLRHWQKTYS